MVSLSALNTWTEFEHLMVLIVLALCIQIDTASALQQDILRHPPIAKQYRTATVSNGIGTSTPRLTRRGCAFSGCVKRKSRQSQEALPDRPQPRPIGGFPQPSDPAQGRGRPQSSTLARTSAQETYFSEGQRRSQSPTQDQRHAQGITQHQSTSPFGQVAQLPHQGSGSSLTTTSSSGTYSPASSGTTLTSGWSSSALPSRRNSHQSGAQSLE